MATRSAAASRLTPKSSITAWTRCSIDAPSCSMWRSVGRWARLRGLDRRKQASPDQLRSPFDVCDVSINLLHVLAPLGVRHRLKAHAAVTWVRRQMIVRAVPDLDRDAIRKRSTGMFLLAVQVAASLATRADQPPPFIDVKHLSAPFLDRILEKRGHSFHHLVGEATFGRCLQAGYFSSRRVCNQPASDRPQIHTICMSDLAGVKVKPVRPPSQPVSPLLRDDNEFSEIVLIHQDQVVRRKRAGSPPRVSRRIVVRRVVVQKHPVPQPRQILWSEAGQGILEPNLSEHLPPGRIEPVTDFDRGSGDCLRGGVQVQPVRRIPARVRPALGKVERSAPPEPLDARFVAHVA